jgi:hypothetical protein
MMGDPFAGAHPNNPGDPEEFSADLRKTLPDHESDRWTRAGRLGQASGVDQVYTVDEARKLLPEVLARADELIGFRADLVELHGALDQGLASALGGRAEAKALEARMSEILGWFSAKGLELKGIAPLLLDFPARLQSETVLLCWVEGERELRWYHKPEHGFAGRRLIPD